MAKNDKFVVHAAPRISSLNTTTVAINRIDAEWFDELKAYSGLNSPTLFRMMRIFCDAHMDPGELRRVLRYVEREYYRRTELL